MRLEFIIGQTYSRQSDIHEPFGGQKQSGIVTPSKYPVIFLFTGKGTRHGYNDEWVEGTFKYFGEGQKGDMTLTKGNKAVVNHSADGKDLLLFEMQGKGLVRYRGAFCCGDYEFVPGKDTEGNNRKAIVFYLTPIVTDTTEIEFSTSGKQNLAELRKRALAAAGPAKERVGSKPRTYRQRSEDVRAYVLARANGVCESCDRPAPFKTKFGAAYLEPHHIRRLTDGGPDDPLFMGGVCPNCHRDIHHGHSGVARNAALLAKVTKKESSH